MKIEELLDAYEIGGIGDIKRKTLRFHSYRTGTEDGKLTLYAVYEKDRPPKMFSGYPSGQELLVELCNLHLSLQGKELPEKAELIREWSLTHVHPYYRYRDFAKYSAFEQDKEDFWDVIVNMIECYYIYVEDMCEDLEKLYADAMMVFTIRRLLEGNESEAKKFYANISPLPGKSFIDTWQKTAPELRPRLVDMFVEKLPKFNMSLQRDEATGNLVFLPEVDSVIAAAYYGLSRFAAVNSGALEDWGGKTSIAFCQACGKAFIKTGNRQKYCNDPTCQSVRNQRKSRDYYYRAQKRKEN